MRGPLGYTIAREFVSMARDPGMRRMLLAAPLLQVLVFSYAATMEVHNVALAVVNQDSGRWSRELVIRLEAAGFVDQVIHAPTTTALADLIERRQVLLAVHFQPDFSRRIEAGQSGPVQLLFDGRRANAGQIVFSYIRNIAAGLQMELAAVGAGPPPRALVRHWFNPNLEYRWFLVPALVATLAMIPALLISTLGVARDRELGTFDQLVVSPVTTLDIILSKLLPAAFAGMLSGLMVFLLAIFAFRINFHGGPLTLLLLFFSQLTFVFAVGGLGLTISAACNTQQQALMGMYSLSIPMMITSGFLTPVENMPVFLQYLAELNPVKHYRVILLGSFFKDMSAAEFFSNLWPMLLISVLSVSIAARIVRWRVQ